MRVVDGRGNVRELVEPGPRVHLGALGVVTEVTLRIEPAFRLAETIEGVRIDKVAGRLGELAASAEYCKVWWMPHTPFAHVFRYERTAELASREPVRQRWVDEKIMHRCLFPALLYAGRLPYCTPPISRFVAKGFMRGRRVGESTLMLSTPMPLRHRETEAVVPMAAAGEAVERVVRVIERDALVVNMPLEIRFVRGDDAWLSPAYGGDVCQLGAYCHGPRASAYFAAFWREMRALRARPHWGKEMDHVVGEVAELWPQFAAFAALRAELDPDGVFDSAFHTRTLGAINA
jgi:FAD/FMN-containing dehydrogenase